MEIEGILLGNPEIYFRIFFSACIGFIIGMERGAKNKPAGIKTYMVVSTACTLITLISIYSVELYGSVSGETVMDPMRLAAQIVTGLGFLGAGLILKEGLHVKGLTSAAMILFAGGVGIGVGAGFYGLVVFSVAIVMLLSKVGNYVETRHLVPKQKDEEH
ncbi:putative Mg2+ transporter-C (MgtC) family protein [Evansella vedderi]|uniref:Mg2+ transporter-C (MgtC) family protein n=1 Tax=Evansella vedderi TaxID=38282 RepID=A0ABT9ZPE5_9BACI|nr:MgtC/SapB family protein [Evansella vedderi]MDQ0253111.1 putative Mg2+ transporter-C (MgtC) family protein [Evansella vedderi]